MKYYALFMLLAAMSCIFAGERAGGDNPLINVNYPQAFNQEQLFIKYAALMEQLGCHQNVLKDATDIESQQPRVPNSFRTGLRNRFLRFRGLAGYENITQQEQSDQERATLLQAFQRDTLSQLRAIRRRAILKPAKESAVLLALMGLATVGAIEFGGEYGGGFSIFALMFNAAFQLRDMSRAVINLHDTPIHPVDALEVQYARNKCFIPRSLWPIIEEKFMLARQNQFAAREASDFLRFALGITLFKPLPPIPACDVDNIVATIHTRIDEFFAGYENVTPREIAQLKINIKRFVFNILGQPSHHARYQYLVGSGGIGKTHFVKKLSEWLSELLPNMIHYEDVVINSPDELEGNGTTPGAFLKIYRNQLQNEKRGSLVFMDEATWLNKMPSESKRTFNGDFSVINTHCFGGGIDGSGIKFPMPPMLIFVASNDEMTDPALTSRFDVTNFPQPKQQTLIKYAHELFDKSSLNALAERLGKTAACREKLEQKIKESKPTSFRQIEAVLEPEIMVFLEN